MTGKTSSASTTGNRVELLKAHGDASILHVSTMGLDASRPLSVSRVADRLAEIVDARLRGVRAIWVQGDIGDLRTDREGTLRFTLSDGRSRIECVWWRPTPTGAVLVDGMQVVVKGRPKVFTRAVGLVYLVAEVRPLGAGVSSMARDELRVRLRAEGLFDATRKRPLPLVPRAVAVITGRASAAWHDVLVIARRRHPGIPVVLVPAQMQGDAAPESICTALRAVESSGLFDIVVITRGGGGAAELMAFDDESLARAIAMCSLPVVTAIGHEVDFSFADAVADCREPTPSAAAARVIPDRHELRQHVDRCHLAMAAAFRHRVDRATSRVGAAQSTLGRSALVQIESGRRRLDRLTADVARGLERRLETARKQAALVDTTFRGALPQLVGPARHRLVASHRKVHNGIWRLVGLEQERSRRATRQLHHGMMAQMVLQRDRHERAAAHYALLDPLSVLRRGYAVMKASTGETITSVNQVPAGATLTVQFHDGALTVFASAAGRVPFLTPGAES